MVDLSELSPSPPVDGVEHAERARERDATAASAVVKWRLRDFFRGERTLGEE